jgi:hypothetical protein
MKIFQLLYLLFPLVASTQTKYNILEERLQQAGKYEYVYAFENDYAVFRTFNKKMGLIDSTGSVVIKPIFSFIYNKKELKNLFEVGNEIGKNFKRGFIDLQGNIKIPIIYDNVFYTEGFIKVTKDKKTGVLDTLNNVVLPICFDNITITRKLIVAGIKGTQGLYDFKGKKINNLEFTWISSFVNDKAVVTFENKTNAIIDNLGNVVLKPIKDYSFKDILNDGLYSITNRLNGKVGVINTKGEFLIKCKYDEIKQVNKLFIAKINKKQGFISLTDSILKPLVYDYIFPRYYYDTVDFGEYRLGDNYIAIKENFYGVINPNIKNDIIPLHYQNVEHLFDKYYIVHNNKNENGVFFENGEKVLHEQYKFYNAFKNSIFATHNNKPLLIHLENKQHRETEVLADEFVGFAAEQQFPVNENQIFILNRKFGVLNYQNQIVIPSTYELIENIHLSKQFIVKKNNKYGVVNSENKIVVEIVYDDFTMLHESILFTKDKNKVKRYHGITYR